MAVGPYGGYYRPCSGPCNCTGRCFTPPEPQGPQPSWQCGGCQTWYPASRTWGCSCKATNPYDQLWGRKP